MKKLLLIPFMLFLAFTIMACNSDSPETEIKEENGSNTPTPGENGKYLVLFTSRSGNTESVAKHITESLKCDILEVIPTTPFDEDYNSMLQRARNEQSAILQGNYPSINTSVENFNDYDVIFIGYPIWHGHMATTMQAFLHKHDEKLKGKRIALFATSGSSGISTSVSEARALCPEAIFTEALLLTSSTLGQTTSRVSTWLQLLNVSDKAN